MTDYQQKIYDQKKKLVEELNSFDSGYKWELETVTEDIERSEVRLHGIYPIYCNYNEYQKEYSFFARPNFPYVRYETIKKVSEGFGIPHNVFKLHANKIKAWVDLWIKTVEELKRISEERQKKVLEFLEECKAEGAVIGNIDPNYNTVSGSINRNGIEFSFQVHDEGYISQKIEVRFSTGNSLETFRELSDNKYRPANV